MRKVHPALVAAAAIATLAGAACTTVTTSVDYDPATSFAAYKTYAFKDTFDRDLFQLKRVKAAMEKTLGAKGLAKAEEGKPDLWVVLHVRTKNDKLITTWSSGWGWGWGWGGGGWMRSHVEDAPVGTLVVDLVDTKAKELVWRGMASRAIDPDETPQERAEHVQAAIDKLFAEFPPAKAPKA